MARLPSFRAICLVLVLLVLASPALSAAGGRRDHQTVKTDASSLLSRAWAGLLGLMAQLGAPAAPTADLGSTMDPDGGK